MYFMVFIYQVPEKQFPFGAHHSIGDTGNFVILWSTTFYYFQHFCIHDTFIFERIISSKKRRFFKDIFED